MVMISGWPPSSAKYRRADSGYDVAMRAIEELLRLRKRRVAQRRDDQLAVSKPERRELFDHDVLLVQEIAADDAEVDRAEPDVARDIVVASIEDGERKVSAVGKEALPVALELQADRMQEIEGVLRQATGALNRHLQWRITGR